MFRHQCASLRGFIKNKDYKYNKYLGASRNCPLYVFYSDMEARVNMLRDVMDGLDGKIVVTIQRVLNLVEMFLRAKKSRSFSKFDW